MIEDNSSRRMESEINTITNTNKSNSTKLLKKNSDEELDSLKKKMKDEIWKEEKCIKANIIYSIDSIAWNFDDSKIAAACWRECIYIYNVNSQMEQIDHQKPAVKDYENGRIAWHPSKNKLVYLGSLNNKIYIYFYDCEKNIVTEKIPLDEEESKESNHKNVFFSWHPHQELVAYNDFKHQIKICSMHNVIKKIPTKLADFSDLKWSFKGDKIAICGQNELNIYNFEEEKLILRITEPPKNMIDNINWLTNDLKIYYKSNSKIKIWNIDEEVEESSFGAISEIQTIDLNCNGKFIVAGNQDKTISIWDAKNLVELMSNPIEEENISVKWNNSGSHLAAKLKRNILIYKFSTNFNSSPQKYPCTKQIKKSFWSPDGKKLLILFDEDYFKIWDSTTKHFYEKKLDSEIKDAEWHSSSEKIVCLLEEGVCYSDGKNSKIYNDEIYPNQHDVHLIRYNYDSSLMAGAGNKIIEIWSINSEHFKVEYEIDAHLRNITDVRWSHKKKERILSASRDGTVKVWDLGKELKTANQVLEIKKHIGFVNCALWDESELHIISFGADQFIRIFNSSNGHQLRMIKTNDEKIKISSWLNVFNENFIIFLQSSEQKIQILDYKTGFFFKSLSFQSEENGKLLPISYVDSYKDGNINQIVVSSEKNILIYDSSKLMNDFETYEYLNFLLEFLPNQKIIQKESSNLIERIVNYFFFEKAPTAFHLLSSLKMHNEFEILIEFCSQHKIYPKRIFDKNTLLFKNLNELPLNLIDLFFDYILKANLPLGNSFGVNSEEIKKYIKKSSSKVLEFLESRVKLIETDQYRFKKYVEDIETLPFLITNFHEIKKEDFYPEIEDFISEKKDESSERPNFKILDIPLVEIGLDFINDVSNSNSFDDFCKSPLFISLLDILWTNLVFQEFLMTNAIYGIYVIILFSNSIIVLPGYFAEIELYKNPNEGSYWIAFLILNILLFLLLIKMINLEISEIKRNKAYKTSFWNYVDWINILLSFSSIIFDVVVLVDGTEEYGLLRVFHSISFFFSIVRIFDLFRLFKNTCFLIEIILQVIIDMRIFLFLMALFISAFSLSGKR